MVLSISCVVMVWMFSGMTNLYISLYIKILYILKYCYSFWFLGQLVTFLWPFIGCLHNVHLGGFLDFAVLLFVPLVIAGTKIKNVDTYFSYATVNLIQSGCVYLGWLEEHLAAACYLASSSFELLPPVIALQAQCSQVLVFVPSALQLHPLVYWFVTLPTWFEICLQHNLYDRKNNPIFIALIYFF